jgi:hypothetical protein
VGEALEELSSDIRYRTLQFAGFLVYDGDMIDFNFKEFLDGIEDSDFFQAAQRTEQELRSVEPFARREFRKREIQRDTRPGKYADKLKGLLFWFHSAMKPAGLSENEFQLIKPLCEKLVQKGQLKPLALDAFQTGDGK